MAGRPGKLQVAFNSAELAPRFSERSELKYFHSGMAYAENIEISPQGGFSVRPGLRDVGKALDYARRLIPFTANDGTVYDQVWGASYVQIWDKTTRLTTFPHPYTGAQVDKITYAQDLDTLLTFHADRHPQRILYESPASWPLDDMPLNNIPDYDYGGVYTNGVAAEWELDFIGFDVGEPLTEDIVFVITVSGSETEGIRAQALTPGSNNPDIPAMAPLIEAAIQALPNVAPGIAVTAIDIADPYRVKVVFGGSDNLSDEWSMSVRVVNKADAAVLATKTVVGKKPGEPLISTLRGWPRCGCFYQQRLLMGGFRSLPAAWMASETGDFFNYDERLTADTGPFLVPLNAPGGTIVEAIVDNQFLLILTNKINMWVAGSTQGLKKTEPPKHVKFSDHGVAAAVPVVANEGAAVYIHGSGDFLGEARYTDIDGNYVAQDLSLLAYHLISGAKDLALQRKADKQSANTAALLNADGSLRLVYLLREQELTGFVRVNSGTVFHAAAVNGRNELSVIADRTGTGGAERSLERFEKGLLLDGAISFESTVPQAHWAGLYRFNGETVWAITGEGHVLGPFDVTGGAVSIGRNAMAVTFGRWYPPRVVTMPIPREIGPNVWLQKKARIHSALIFVEDTTSIAVGANGEAARNVPLYRWGQPADVPELQTSYTGLVTVRGLLGYQDQPQLEITQLRPGRLTVKSVILEATL